MKHEEKFHYSIDHKNNVVFKKVSGEISMDELISFNKMIFSDLQHKKGLNILTDISDSFPSFHVFELNKIISFLSTKNEVLSNAKFAFIIKSPRHAVDTQIVKDMSESINLNVHFEIFSTYEAACRWLNINY